MQIKVYNPKSKKDNPFTSPRWGDSTISNTFKTDKQEMSAYEKIEWVSICVDRLYADVGRCIYFTDQKGLEIDLNRVDKSILEPIQKGFFNDTFIRLIQRALSHRLITGNAYLLKAQTNMLARVEKTFDEFIPLSPDEVEPLTDSTKKKLLGYKIKLVDGTEFKVPRDMVVHFSQNALYNNPFIGVGNISKMRLMIEGEAEASEFSNEFMERRAAPSIAITSNEEILMDDYNRKIDLLRSKYEGKGNRGKLMYIAGGQDGNVKIEQFSLSQKDMQFLEQKINNRQTIISMFGCNSSILGIPDGVNRATAQIMKNQYYENVNVILGQLEEDLNKQFVKLIDPNINIKFRKWATGDIELITQAINSGIITPNRGAELIGEYFDEQDSARNSYYLPQT